MFAFFNTLEDRGVDGNGGVNSLPSAMRKTVLKTDEIKTLEARLASLRDKLRTPNQPILSAWENIQQLRIQERRLGLELIPIKLIKISTPNSGVGFTIEGNKFMGLGKAVYDLLGETPKTQAPITGLRLVFPNVDEPAKTAKGKAVAKPKSKMAGDFPANFILTAVDATADKIPGDQVNIHKLIKFSRITASSWVEGFPAADVRAFDVLSRGWGPDPKLEGPAHITLTFTTPITAETHPYLTTQIYFGNRMGGNPS
ncbi:MAG: hypothetical protein EBS64_11460, partial [Verrucomicrobia bacterium]|nr:hypothetical protein [Verrucomicrobiota bacterium]